MISQHHGHNRGGDADDEDITHAHAADGLARFDGGALLAALARIVVPDVAHA